MRPGLCFAKIPKEEETMKKLFSMTAAMIVGLGSLTACSGYDWNKQPNYYRPASFGENGKCYYVQDREEAEKLKKEKLCDDGWQPALAPNPWLFMYMPYYSSDEYRDYYVSERNRSRYKTYTTQFGTKYKSNISLAQSKAVYTDNFGKKVDGNKVPRGQFGGGLRSKGGSGIRMCSSLVANDLSLKGGGGGGRGGGGGSRGGGSSKSGSSKSGTSGKSGSNSKSDSGATRTKC
jgi:hypothetical protein